MKKIKFTTLLFLLPFLFCEYLFAQNSAAKETVNMLKANSTILIIAGILLFIWLLLVIIYLVWAIHKYNDNYGLSNHEWKVLHPEMYADEKEKKKYITLRDKLISAKQNIEDSKAIEGESAQIITAPFGEPEDNPYKCDSFGLPPNTIRGLIALTALVMFLLMEMINFFSAWDIESNFKELTLVFQMIIAFYFGSRAIEVLKAKTEKGEKKEEEDQKKKNEEEKKKVEEERLKNGSSSSPVNPKTEVEEAEEVSIHQAAIIPEEKSSGRIISAIENSQSIEIPEDILNKFKDENGIKNKPLNERVLALTGSFETGEGFPKCFAGLTNNFDGQGISFGVLQWNFGQGSLPPLLQKMNNNYPDICKNIFGSLYYDFERMLKMPKAEQLAWAKSIQYTQVKNGKTFWYIDKQWIKAFKDIGLTSQMITIQAEASNILYQRAFRLAGEYELTTERGVALMFDIITQNGSVDKNGSGRRIREDYLKLPSYLTEDEKQVEKMTIIANRRSEVSKPAYIKDVKARKLTIATGEGKVHSKNYNLAEEFNITLKLV